MACRDKSPEIKKEAVWALCNITYKVDDPVYLEKLLENDIMNIIIELIQHDSENGTIISLALDTLETLFSNCKDQASVAFHSIAGQ